MLTNLAWRKFQTACFLFLIISCGRTFAGSAAAHPEMLVSTEWLADHLNDPKVVILQVGHDRSDYDKEHIAGARFLGTHDYTTGDDGGLITELPPVEKLQQLFQDAGVSDDTRVIIYTADWYPVAGRAYFTLDYLGHSNAALLDGSLAKWKAENRPVTAQVPQPPKGSFTPHVNESARALLADAKAASGGSQTMLVDSRPLKRYTDGHLPGADHIFWEETVQSSKQPVFLQPDDLRKLFESRGVASGKKVITYCEIGLQASHMYFVSKYLGYSVAMFDGSFYQWNDLEHLPVVKGSAPR